MMSNTFRLAAALTLFEILTTLAHAAPLEVSETVIKNCQFLGNVDGYSGYGKHLTWKQIAKHNALQKADAFGATHVVYTNYKPIGAWNGEASARVYDCH